MNHKFLPNDIIKDGDYYRRVHGMLGEVVLTSGAWGEIGLARICHTVLALHPADYANWTIVERGGKPHVPEKWEPMGGCTYYVPDPTEEKLTFGDVWAGNVRDALRLERGLVYEYASDAAAHARRMLEVK